jgi:hypothetical protein
MRAPSESFDLGVGHRKVVSIEHDDVGELARLDRADLLFHTEEPAVASRK